MDGWVKTGAAWQGQLRIEIQNSVRLCFSKKATFEQRFKCGNESHGFLRKDHFSQRDQPAQIPQRRGMTRMPSCKNTRVTSVNILILPCGATLCPDIEAYS